MSPTPSARCCSSRQACRSSPARSSRSARCGKSSKPPAPTPRRRRRPRSPVCRCGRCVGRAWSLRHRGDAMFRCARRRAPATPQRTFRRSGACRSSDDCTNELGGCDIALFVVSRGSCSLWRAAASQSGARNRIDRGDVLVWRRRDRSSLALTVAAAARCWIRPSRASGSRSKRR